MTLHLDSFLAEGETDCGCKPRDKTCPVAQAILGRAIGDLPLTLNLYFRERDDRLSEEQLSEIFDTGLEAVQEQIDEWFFDTVHYSVEYHLEDLIDGDCKTILDEHDLLGLLEEEIRDRDESDPFGELAAACWSVWLRHPTHVEVEEGPVVDEVRRICRELQVEHNAANDLALRYLLVDVAVEGELELAWECDLPEVLEKFYWGRDPDEKRDDLLLRIKDVQVGADGYWVVLNGLVTVPLKVDDVRYISHGDQPQDKGKQSVEVISEFDAYKQQLERFINYRQHLLEGLSNGAS